MKDEIMDKVHISFEEAALKMLRRNWGRPDVTDITEHLKTLGVDEQAVCFHALSAKILLEILSELKIISKPIKKENAQIEQGYIQQRASEMDGRLRKLKKKLLKYSVDDRAICRVFNSIAHHLEYDYPVRGAWWWVERADYFIKTPIEKWSDKRILSLPNVAKKTLAKYKTEMKQYNKNEIGK